MIKKISAYKARTNLGEVLNEVYYGNKEYIVERAGKPMVRFVRVSFDRPESLEDLSLKARQALKKDKANLADLLDNLEADRECFYKTYLRKYNG